MIQYNFEIYRENKRWFFDDISKAIKHEEFVSKVPKVIESLLTQGESKLNVLISDEPLINSDATLSFSRKVDAGVYYYYKNLEVWFCPTFWKYFTWPVPQTIWIKKI